MSRQQIGRPSQLPVELSEQTDDVTSANALDSTAAAQDEMEFLPQSVKRPRRTPRNSATEAAVAEAVESTPYETLRQLANIASHPTTPNRRASSAGPPSTHASSRRTPAARTPGPGSRPNSIRRPTVATPYAQAARRGLEERRTAALTPGKNRRQSLRQREDTPGDVLRLLSRILPPGPNIPSSSPDQPGPATGKVATKRADDDLEDDFDLRPPRLSLPLGDDDEEDSILDPPERTPIPDEENLTQLSIENARRAPSGQASRLSRGSFGSIRTSDGFNLGLDNSAIEGIDSSFIRPGTFEEDDQSLQYDDPTMVRDFTGDLRQAFGVDPFGRISQQLGRSSDVRIEEFPQDDTERSFAFTVPQRDSTTGRVSLGERSLMPEADELPNEDDNTSQAEEEEDASALDLEDVSMLVPSAEPADTAQGRRKPKKKSIKVSKHGIQYPLLPMAVVKKLATTFMKTSGHGKAKLSKDTLEAIMQASDWFFEQISDDLGIYSKHASRKTIDESDVLTLMKRQRQTNASTTPFALAQRYLPRELLQDIRMAAPSRLRKGRPLERVDEANEE